ncbi:hypothetical protein EDB83DRAFT_2323681 [Lactarius deliciosus]|nr:hypothetical protein EDB83DRAFT_2323681 [Lactarius deliciosus]
MTMTHRKHNQRTARRAQAIFGCSRRQLIFDVALARVSSLSYCARFGLARGWRAHLRLRQKRLRALGAGRWALASTQPAGFRELRGVRPAAGSRRSIRSRNFRSILGGYAAKEAKERERRRTEARLPPPPSRLTPVATRVEGKPVRKVQTPRATLVARRAAAGGRCRSFGGGIPLLGRIRNQDILTLTARRDNVMVVRETTHGAVASEEGWKLVFLTLQTDRQDSAKANSAHASSCFPLLFLPEIGSHNGRTGAILGRADEGLRFLLSPLTVAIRNTGRRAEHQNKEWGVDPFHVADKWENCVLNCILPLMDGRDFSHSVAEPPEAVAVNQ